MSVDDAMAFILSKAAPIADIEDLEVSRTLGRVLAQSQISTIDVPPTDNSAMDGFAFASHDATPISDDGDIRLPVSQRIAAGQTSQPLVPGTAARIFTGAPIPSGADSVVMQEHCRMMDDGSVIISPPFHPGNNIRKRGEDVKKDTTILESGMKLRPQDMGLVASIGVAHLPVYRPLRVAIFCTGDELTMPGAALVPGKIYNANRYTLTGLLHALRCEVIDFGIVPDNMAATRTVLATAARQSDLIITSGGVSVGDEDHVKAAVEALGHLDMWRIAMKPGKPLAFGSIDVPAHDTPTPFFGLPGNPVSVFATFCLFVRPFILRRQGMTHPLLPQPVPVCADFDWLQSGNRREYLRARLNTGTDGATRAIIYPNQSSAALTSVSWAHGLICITEGTTVQRGQMANFIPFTELLS